MASSEQCYGGLRCYYKYLEKSEYPSEQMKDAKRNFRQKCRENFKIEDGQLFHRKFDRGKTRKGELEAELVEQNWAVCIRTDEEKQSVEVMPFISNRYGVC